MTVESTESTRSLNERHRLGYLDLVLKDKAARWFATADALQPVKTWADL